MMKSKLRVMGGAILTVLLTVFLTACGSGGGGNGASDSADFVGSLSATTTQCSPPEEDDAFTLSGSITVAEQDGEAFDATGELAITRFGVDFELNIQFSGTVAVDGELSGTFTETFMGTNGFSSSGNGNFTGNMTESTLNIQVSGQDADNEGITCVLTGTFTGK